MKKALITGITGQDGSYLAELLLSKGYHVWGIMRRSSTFSTQRIEHLYHDPHEKPALRLVYGDLTDGSNNAKILHDVGPDEVYNLGAQSHVRVSFDIACNPHRIRMIIGRGSHLPHTVCLTRAVCITDVVYIVIKLFRQQ